MATLLRSVRVQSFVALAIWSLFISRNFLFFSDESPSHLTGYLYFASVPTVRHHADQRIVRHALVVNTILIYLD